MTNRILLFVFLSLNFTQLAAQSQIDSLKGVLRTTKIDTVKVNVYLEFFFTDLFFEDQTAVIDYSHKARILSSKINFNRGLANSHNNLGYIYRVRSENDSAFYHYSRAIKISEPIAYYKGVTDAYIGMGNTYNQLGEWEDAIKQFATVMDLARKEGDSIQIGSAYNNIGNTFLNQSKFEPALINYQKAVKLGDASIRGTAMVNIAVVHNQMGNTKLARSYFQKSIAEAERLGKKGHLAFITRSLGILEKKEGNFEKSLRYYNQALETYETLSDDFSQAEIIQNMGNVYLELKDYQKALEHYDRSLQIQKNINYPLGACYNQLYMGTALQASGRLEEATAKLLLAESCAKELAIVGIQADAAEIMSSIKAEQGDYSAALTFHEKFKMLSDSLRTIVSDEKIAELDTKFQTAQKEQEIELLSAENEISKLKIQKKDNLRNYMIGGAILLVILLIVIYNRYTLKMRANKKLQELDDLKNKFYTDISHEFRTPLTLILGPLNTILSKDTSSIIEDNVRLAHRNVDRLLELTNQMLDLSKIEAGKMNLKVREEETKPFLEIVFASFESLALARQKTFIKNFSITDEKAYFDVDILQKILYNLLSNAFKFTASGDHIEFKATERNGNLQIEIKDSGSGFNPQETEKLFNRFQQGNNTHETTGTGVGLTLTKELVLLHQGTIDVVSKPNVGSNFKISIPIHKRAYKSCDIVNKEGLRAKPEKFTAHSTQEDNLVDKKLLPIVLIVEDNDELRHYLGSLFKGEYQVNYAIDGKEGVAQALQTIPDLIISDWMMPQMNGDELCKILKKNEKTSHIPIILLTAKTDQESKIDGLTIGADDYISKPFDNTELLVRVKNLIEQRKLLCEKYGGALLIEPSKVHLPDPDKSFIKRAIAIVEQHISDDTFSSEDFQKALGMSRMQLYRKLKALTDTSASEFIRNIRLQRASDLLSQNRLQVSEVAYQCGFTNLSYFGQCFKEKFGVPPSQFVSE